VRQARGYAFLPLDKNAPQAALKDHELYQLIALVNALRDGSARARELAKRDSPIGLGIELQIESTAAGGDASLNTSRWRVVSTLEERLGHLPRQLVARVKGWHPLAHRPDDAIVWASSGSAVAGPLSSVHSVQEAWNAFSAISSCLRSCWCSP